MISRSVLSCRATIGALKWFPLCVMNQDSVLMQSASYHHKAKVTSKSKSDGRRNSNNDNRKKEMMEERRSRVSDDGDGERVTRSNVTDEGGRTHSVYFSKSSLSNKSSPNSSSIKSVSTLSTTATDAVKKVQTAATKKDIEKFLVALEELKTLERRDQRQLELHSIFTLEFTSALKPAEASLIVRMLGNIKAFDADLGRDSRLLANILHNALKSSEPFSYKHINDMLRGLSEMNFKASSMSKEDEKMFHSLLIEELPRIVRTPYISNILRNLAGMEAKWATLPPELADAITMVIHKRLRQFDVKTGSMLVYALANLDLNIAEVQEAFKSNLVDLAFNIVAMVVDKEKSPQNAPFLNQTLLGMGRMGMRFSQLDSEFQFLLIESVEKFLPMMGTRVASVLYSYGLMGVKWSEIAPVFKESVQTQFLARVDEMEAADLTQCFRGFQAMLGKTAWADSDMKPEVKLRLRKIQVLLGI